MSTDGERRYGNVRFIVVAGPPLDESADGVYVRVPDLVALLLNEAELADASASARPTLTALAGALAARAVEAEEGPP